MMLSKNLNGLWGGLLIGASMFAQSTLAQSTARVERSPSGVLVMRGSRPAPPPEPAAEAVEVVKAPDKQEETPAQVAVRMLRNSGDVGYLSGDKSKQQQSGSSESTYREYSSAGEFVPADTTRTTTRQLADGTIETVAAVFATDVNGREQLVRKTTTRERKVGTQTTSVQTTELPGVNGGFRTAERVESVTTDNGNAGTSVDTVRFINTGVSASLVEIARESSVMRQTERGATTETTIYERSTVNGRTELAGRKIGRITQDDDGSVHETVEVYGRFGGTQEVKPIALQRVVRRSVTVGSNGDVNESVSSVGKGVMAGSDFRTQRVARVTEDGFVEVTTFEQNANGQMYAKGVSVEPLDIAP
jgi:hypothetical protein